MREDKPNSYDLFTAWLQDSFDSEWRAWIEKGRGKPFLITGPSGCGKTSLMTLWARLSEARGAFTTFVTVAPQSGTSTLRGLIEHVEDHLKPVLSLEEGGREQQAVNWQEALGKLLGRIHPDKQTALLIDDADCLEPIYDAWEMAWLPRRLPPHVRCVFSCGSGGSSSRILRAFGSAELTELPTRDGATLRDLFRSVLEGLEGRYGREAASSILSALTCSRMGLAGNEIQALTRAEIPPGVCRDLLDGLAPYLNSSRNILHLAHSVYDSVVRERYLQSHAEALRIHRLLAAFFSGAGRAERFFDEVVWHRVAAGDREQLESLLCDPWFVEMKCRGQTVGEVEDDYERALAAVETKAEPDSEREAYLRQLIAYARRNGVANRTSPPCDAPRPPESITPHLQPVPTDAPDPLNKLRAFRDTLRDHRDFLRESLNQQGVFIQLAYNHPTSLVMRETARATLRREQPSMLLILRRANDESTPDTKTEWERGYSITIDHRSILSRGLRGSYVKIWDAKTARIKRILNRASGEYDACRATPDGKRLLAGGGPGSLYGRREDYALHIWDMDLGRLLGVWQGHSGNICDIEITSDGRWCATASRQSVSHVIGTAPHGEIRGHTVMIWDLMNGSAVGLPVRHGVRSLALGPDGILLAVAEMKSVNSAEVVEPSVKLLDRLTGRELRRFPLPPDCWNASLRITPDGRKLILFTSDQYPMKRELHIFDLSRDAHQMLPQDETITAFEVTPDGHHLVTLSGQSYDHPPRMRVIGLQDGKTIAVAQIVSSHDLALVGSWCVVGGRDGNGFGEDVHVYDILGLPRGAAAVTAARLFRHDTASVDDNFTTFCAWCGSHLAVEEKAVSLISGIQSRFRDGRPPCLAQWQAEWSEEELETVCESCGGRLRFNPFLVGGR